jgi:four helix bundle protein
MTHKDLDVWKNSLDLVEEIYKVTEKFPKSEIYILTNQIRRAAISIPSNISEGAARNTPNDFIRFLYISLGSLSEVETQLIISIRLKYISQNELNNIDRLINLIRIEILGLIKSVKKKSEEVTE